MRRSILTNLTCELDQIAPILLNCKYDLNAIPGYSLVADAIYWTDEWPAQLFPDTAFRYLLHFRTLVIMERSASAPLYELWNKARERFPAWPGFSIARSLPSVELQLFYTEHSESAEKLLSDSDDVD